MEKHLKRLPPELSALVRCCRQAAEELSVPAYIVGTNPKRPSQWAMVAAKTIERAAPDSSRQARQADLLTVPQPRQLRSDPRRHRLVRSEPHLLLDFFRGIVPHQF